jgi:hypothetical protein
MLEKIFFNKKFTVERKEGKICEILKIFLKQYGNFL